jgi:hypothetical protein
MEPAFQAYGTQDGQMSRKLLVERSRAILYLLVPCPCSVCVLPTKALSSPACPPESLTCLSDQVGFTKSNTMAFA